MPNNESVVWPSSHCPHCKKRLPAYDNIPFISYMLLGGRCRSCKKKISLRYPMVELLTAVMFVLLFRRYGLSYDFFCYMVFTCALIVASFIDIPHRIIPDEISLGGTVVGLVLMSVKGFNFAPFSFNFRPMLNSLLGIIVGGGSIFLTAYLFDLVYFKLFKRPAIQGETESMGGGDVKLLAMIGAFIGWQRVLVTFFLAAVIGSLVGLANLIKNKDHTFPFGPSISLAALISLFWAHKIIAFIIGK
jgi:leader peptidase (prepilin peptidase)/N-methyltransferase